MEIKAAKAKTFSHTNIGLFDDFLKNGPGENVSKQFFRDLLGLTGMEMSVTAYPAGTALPFFHAHKQNEELYIILKGRGQMRLDDQEIEVSEGSVIKVLPECSRNLRSAADSDIVFMCIQAKTGSLEQCNREDGMRTEGKFASDQNLS